MATEITPEILDAIEAVLRQAPAGMTYDELANAFDPPANMTDLKVWLQALGDQRRCMFFRENGRMNCILPEVLQRKSAGNPVDGGAASDATARSSAGAGENTPAAPSDDAAAGGDPGTTSDLADSGPFVALFSQCVLPIVGGLMPRASATAFLQLQARPTFETPEERTAYVAYALAQLDAITPDYAPEYELTAEQVSAWRLIYDAAPSACRAGSPNPAVIEYPSSGEVANAPRRAPAATSVRGQPGRPANAGGARARVGTTARVTLPLRSPDLQREVQAAVTDVAQDMAREMATTWDLRAAAKRAGEAMKATLTPGRGLFAVVWACAVFWAVQYYLKTAAMHATATSAQRIALLGQMVGLGTVPLCGLPWLGFRWWDVRTRDGLTVVDVAMTLLVGGVLGLMLANVVVSLGSCMSGLVPK